MDQNAFEFHIAQVIRQLQELKIDFKQDIDRLREDILSNLKSRDQFYNEFRLDVHADIIEHKNEIQELKKDKFLKLGAVGVLVFVLEISFRVFDYYLLKAH